MAPDTDKQQATTSRRDGTLRARPVGARTQFIVDARGHLLPGASQRHSHSGFQQNLGSRVPSAPLFVRCSRACTGRPRPTPAATGAGRRAQDARRLQQRRRVPWGSPAALVRRLRCGHAACRARGHDGLQGHRDRVPARQHHNHQDSGDAWLPRAQVPVVLGSRAGATHCALTGPIASSRHALTGWACWQRGGLP